MSVAIYSPPPIDNHASFKNEARSQGVCANCGRGGAWHPHHVLYEQACRRLGVPRFSPDNALRTCERPIDGCHGAHHSRKSPIKLTALRDVNIQFCAHFMGRGKAYNYLTKRYAGTDPRVEALLDER